MTSICSFRTAQQKVVELKLVPKMNALRQAVFFAIVAVLVVYVLGEARISKRSEPSSESPAKKEPCIGRTPCGWAIYNRTYRYVDYFMRNRCVCDGEKKCLRDEDDISITAYVYRCKIEEEDQSKS